MLADAHTTWLCDTAWQTDKVPLLQQHGTLQALAGKHMTQCCVHMNARGSMRQSLSEVVSVKNCPD